MLTIRLNYGQHRRRIAVELLLAAWDGGQPTRRTTIELLAFIPMTSMPSGFVCTDELAHLREVV
jgi:hypothetical protein